MTTKKKVNNLTCIYLYSISNLSCVNRLTVGNSKTKKHPPDKDGCFFSIGYVERSTHTLGIEACRSRGPDVETRYARP